MQAAVLSVVLISFWLVVTHLSSNPSAAMRASIPAGQGPDEPDASPYSMRVLVPWLVHALGGDVVTTFHAVSLVCLAITGWLIYLLARQLGVGHGYALLAGGALVQPGLALLLRPLRRQNRRRFLLLTAAFLVLVRNRRTWFRCCLLAVLMAATREQFIGFALPTYFWLYHRHHAWRALSQTIGLLGFQRWWCSRPWRHCRMYFLRPILATDGVRLHPRSPHGGDGWLWFASGSPCHWECGGRWLWSACVLTGFDGCPGGRSCLGLPRPDRLGLVAVCGVHVPGRACWRLDDPRQRYRPLLLAMVAFQAVLAR